MSAAKTKMKSDADRIRPVVEAALGKKVPAAPVVKAEELVSIVSTKPAIDPDKLAEAKRIAEDSQAALADDSKASGDTTSAEPKPDANTSEPASIKTGTTEPAKTTGGGSLFDDIKRKTEEDKQEGGTLTQVAESFNSETPDTSNLEDDSPELKKARAQISASAWVEGIDIFFMLVCMLLTWDFSETNQKTYTLHKDRKAALKDPIFRMLMLKKKKTSPGRAIVTIAIGSYAPMLIMAIVAFIARMKRKEDDKMHAATLLEANNHNEALKQSLSEMQLRQAQVQRENEEMKAQIQFNLKNQHIPNQDKTAAPSMRYYRENQVSVKPKKDGLPKARTKHLHWCASWVGKPCNCKNYIHKIGCASFSNRKCDCHKTKK